MADHGVYLLRENQEIWDDLQKEALMAQHYSVFPTPLGPCGIVWEGDAIICLQLPEATKRATRAKLLSRARLSAESGETFPPAWVMRAISKIERHLRGEPQDLEILPVRYMCVPESHVKIYEALRKVPPGQAVTYSQLAALAGLSPRAARIVGRAMATNPLPLLVPCHRFMAAGGKPGGFTAFGGLETKAKILAAEAAKEPLPYDAKEALAHLARAEPALAKLIAQVGPLKLSLKHTSDTFTALAEAIVYQQLTAKAAGTIFGRLLARFPNRRLTPKRLLALTDQDLRSVGLSNNKTRSLRDLAEHELRGEIPSVAELGRMTDEEIIERLTVVRGIGRWTVEMLLIFRLGRPDVFPVSDYGVRKGFDRICGERKTGNGALPSAEVMERRGEKWRPFRSVASWYLWRALELP
jgi:methylated-DNA-[protein]-cysteine S-methyltransferase